MRKLFILLSIFCVFSITQATIINVPTDIDYIQGGINLAVNGDTVLVQPGTYYENINFNGKAITVSSQFIMDGDTSHINNTIINGSQPANPDSGSVVYFLSGEDTTSILCGFTISGGGGTNNLDGLCGGGIFIYQSGTHIVNNKIINNINNWDPSYGGGIFVSDSSDVIISDVSIKNNSAMQGAGIYCCRSKLNIKDSFIFDNSSPYCGDGGGILLDRSNLFLNNVQIRNNTVEHGGGGIFSDSSVIKMKFVEVWNNSAKDGGGICSYYSTLELENLNISYCKAKTHWGRRREANGGGIYCYGSKMNLAHVNINNNYSEDYYGGIANLYNSQVVFDTLRRCNIFLNNAKNYFGNDIYTYNNISIVVDTFTVMNPTEQQASPLDSISFDILNAKVLPINSDLYVSVNGYNNNSGLSLNDPLQSISFALMKIDADSLNQRNIYVDDGIYSNSTTGETFPMHIPNYVSLTGDSQNGVIIDAEEHSEVIRFLNNRGNNIQNLSITGGARSSSFTFRGGGIYCENSSVNITNVNIYNNTRLDNGGGIICSNSSLNITDAIISGNVADNGNGGGIYCINSILKMAGLSIRGNIAEDDYGEGNGGGIYIGDSSTLLFDVNSRCNIYLNYAENYGNDLYSENTDITPIFLDTYTVLQPTQYNAYPLNKFTFDVLHSKVNDRNGLLNTIIDSTNLDSLVHYLRVLSGEDSVTFAGNTNLISSRTRNQPGNDIAADYINYKLQSFGLPVYDQIYSASGRNVYAVQIGIEYPDDKYIICAHYDADTSYCADDNASGVASVLEAARLLSKYETNHTVIYAFWDEEEMGLGGSEYFAQQASQNNENILGVINLEMLGWDSNNDGLMDIHTQNIANSIELSSVIDNLKIILNLNLLTQIKYPGNPHSDHGSFWQYGYGATVFGGSFDDFNPYYHSSNDRIDKFNLNYFHKLSKLAAASISFFTLPDEITKVLENIIIVSEFKLRQNYPNPFNPTTTIEFSIPKNEYVKLQIYNILGQKVATLFSEELNSGSYKVDWNAHSFASGIYIYRLETKQGFVQSRKMILLK